MLLEQLARGLMRGRTDHCKGPHVIARIVNASLGDLLGLTQRSAHGNDGGLVLLDPRFPGQHSFSFLRAALAFGKGIPGSTARTGLAAEEHREISIICSHEVSF